jgi:hypothetical protein
MTYLSNTHYSTFKKRYREIIKEILALNKEVMLSNLIIELFNLCISTLSFSLLRKLYFLKYSLNVYVHLYIYHIFFINPSLD